MREIANEPSFRSMIDNPSMKIMHDEFDRYLRQLVDTPASTQERKST